MLDQQNLLGALCSAMAADALLDRLRERGTLEGGRSAPQEGCWIKYNRKAVWLEDHSGFSEAMKAASTHKQAWRRIRPKVVLKVTWAEAAAHGTTPPQELRTELDALRRNEREREPQLERVQRCTRPVRRPPAGGSGIDRAMDGREGSSAHLSRQKLSVPDTSPLLL